MGLTVAADLVRPEEAIVAKPKKPASEGKRPRPRPDAKQAPVEEGGTLADAIPYLSWAAATDYRYLGGWPERGLPVLLALREPVRQFAAEVRKAGLEELIRIPELFTEPADWLTSVAYCPATIDASVLKPSKARDALQSWTRRIEFGLPNFELPQLPSKRVPNPNRAPKHVVTAVMDDALPFVHERFRRAIDDTRVEYLWKQGLPGLVLSRAQIRAAMGNHRHAGILDEDAVYRELGFENPADPGHKALFRRRAHGAHVMDLACDPRGRTELPPIIGVQFPASAIRDTSGAWLAPHVYFGLIFVLHMADQLACDEDSGPLPVVVNVSYGKFADSHDGQSPLELAMDELIEARRAVAPFAVVVPSGNSFLDRCHAKLELAPGKARTLRWRVPPDDRTPSFLEVWPGPAAPDGTAPALGISLKTPDGSTVVSATRGASPQWAPGGLPLASVEYRVPGPLGPHRDMVLLTLAPTATLNANEAVAPAGTWEVEVRNADPECHVEIEAWIQRDDTPYGWPITGRQSRFDEKEYVRFDPAGRYLRAKAAGTEFDDDPNSASSIRRDGSLNAIATGRHPVVIGAFRKSDWTAGAYSSGGPIPPGTRSDSTPDALLVGDDSPVCDGVLAAGTRSGSTVAMRGTSVAAPQIARWLAKQMEDGLAADRDAVQALAADADPGSPPVRPERKGGGRVDVRPPGRVPRRDAP
jgi:hypothetical protein